MNGRSNDTLQLVLIRSAGKTRQDKTKDRRLHYTSDDSMIPNLQTTKNQNGSGKIKLTPSSSLSSSPSKSSATPSPSPSTSSPSVATRKKIGWSLSSAITSTTLMTSTIGSGSSSSINKHKIKTTSSIGGTQSTKFWNVRRHMMMILHVFSMVVLGMAMVRLLYTPTPDSTYYSRATTSTSELIPRPPTAAINMKPMSTHGYVIADDASSHTGGNNDSNNKLRRVVSGGGGGSGIDSRNRNHEQQRRQDPQPVLHPQDTYKLRVPQPISKHHIDFLRGPHGPKYNVLVTGAAGFVGMHTSIELSRLGLTPIGYDNVNSYYSTTLKESRIYQLSRHNITFVRGDVCDISKLTQTMQEYNITRVIHLAAQAGVRFSLDHPLEYTHNNIDCTVNLMETMVALGITGQPLVYASSSSVYGNNVKVPFHETDPVDDPASLYAATKRTNELLARTYYNLYNLTSVGLRFFTVYGPFGRPDMSPWIFTEKIMTNETLPVFNYGKSQRDFTYIDDIVQGVVNSLLVDGTGQPEVVNLGNGSPIVLADFVRVLEENVGRIAEKHHMPMQRGDVPVTFADITKARYLLGYNPSTTIEDGIRYFVSWFQEHQANNYRVK